jgi:hypothetical protein
MRIFRRFFVPLVFVLLLLGAPRAGDAQVAVTVTVAPPALPVYVQPPIPGPGWLWTPGYWAWGPYGYYWVPGTWVRPPRVGLLWTPGYWGWLNGAYIWHAGYWGPHIGFYGGINYGFGYIGVGFYGGFWAHGVFHYNAAVNNIRNVHVTVYRQTTVNNINITRNVNVTRVSYNGGRGGIVARPNSQELAAEREQHVRPTALQNRHANMARGNAAMRASVNHGRPSIAATQRPGAFGARGVVRAQGAAPYHGARRAPPRGQIHNASQQHRPGPARTAQRNQQHPQHPQKGQPNGGGDNQRPMHD